MTRRKQQQNKNQEITTTEVTNDEEKLLVATEPEVTIDDNCGSENGGSLRIDIEEDENDESSEKLNEQASTFTCIICNETNFNDSTVLQNHLIQKHVGCPVLFERCSYCNTRIHFEVYEQHVKIHHPQQYQQQITQQQQQILALQQQQLLQQQLISQASQTQVQLQTSKKRKEIDATITQPLQKKGRYLCECGTSFEQETSLKIHKHSYCEHANTTDKLTNGNTSPEPSLPPITTTTTGPVSLVDPSIVASFPSLLESITKVTSPRTTSVTTATPTLPSTGGAVASSGGAVISVTEAQKKYICNVCGRGWNDLKTFRSHKELYCGKNANVLVTGGKGAKEAEKNTARVLAVPRLDGMMSGGSQKIKSSEDTNVTVDEVEDKNKNDANSSILSIFGQMIELFGSLQPDQQQELKSIMVKKESR